ncbi:MAG: 3-keto-5-aminohexanoate cleavage protein [Parasphingorhabdus sp.]
MNEEKLILTAAITGIVEKKDACPAIPYTPVEMGEEAQRAVNAGASIIHIHGREDDGSGSFRTEVYEEIHEEVRKRCPDVILNYTTGAIGLSREERVQHIVALKPDIATFNMGSMNYAIYSEEEKKFIWNDVFENSFDTMIYAVEAINSVGTTPEMECFDVSHINNVIPMRDMGVIKDNAYYSLVMGVLGGIPPSTENLIHLVKQLPADAVWQMVSIDRQQWRLAALASMLGGNFRVGLEDNFYLPNGEMAKSNGELVDCGVQLARTMGREVASIEETRKIMNMPFRN